MRSFTVIILLASIVLAICLTSGNSNNGGFALAHKHKNNHNNNNSNDNNNSNNNNSNNNGGNSNDDDDNDDNESNHNDNNHNGGNSNDDDDNDDNESNHNDNNHNGGNNDDNESNESTEGSDTNGNDDNDGDFSGSNLDGGDDNFSSTISSNVDPCQGVLSFPKRRDCISYCSSLGESMVYFKDAKKVGFPGCREKHHCKCTGTQTTTAAPTTKATTAAPTTQATTAAPTTKATAAPTTQATTAAPTITMKSSNIPQIIVGSTAGPCDGVVEMAKKKLCRSYCSANGSEMDFFNDADESGFPGCHGVKHCQCTGGSQSSTAAPNGGTTIAADPCNGVVSFNRKKDCKNYCYSTYRKGVRSFESANESGFPGCLNKKHCQCR